MSKKTSKITKKVSFVTIGLVSLSVFFNHLPPISTISAQVIEEVNVTASVPDNGGPTTPILISPTNNSYVTDSTPDFVWQRSTDTNGIGKYVLSLDGSTLFDNIPTTNTDNANYTLTYNSSTLRYTLTPKSSISNGSHTWSIRAVDTTGNGTNSATWTFTMDTQAPNFVINTFGELSVSISAQDAGTIPSSPLLLQNNEPLILATGEANSDVAVILTIPGDPSQNFSTTINGSGNWSLQLGILPRDVEMTLDITITDLAGNVSVLSGLDFIIESEVIVFPPVSPTPTPSPSLAPTPSPTPTPGVTPSPQVSPSPSPSAVVLPTVPPQNPIIEIPIIPPREVAFEITQEILERIPQPIRQLANSLPENVRKTIQDSAPISGLLVSAALPVASAIAIGSQFGGGLSVSVIIKLLQALGLIPSGKPQGLVFNSKTYEPVPFALLTISNPTSTKTLVTETVVTDVQGVYRGIKLPVDSYQLTVSHQDFTFPTQEARPQYVSFKDFYKGELFQVSSTENEQLFLIPVDPINKQGRAAFGTKLRIKLAQFSKLTSILVLPLFIISGFLALLFPSIWNWLVFGLYALSVGYKAVGWFKVPIISGTVIDDLGNIVENAIVRISVAETNELNSVIRSNKNGEFRVFGPKQKYLVAVSKPGYIMAGDNVALSFLEINATSTSQNIIITMESAAKLYEGLF